MNFFKRTAEKLKKGLKATKSVWNEGFNKAFNLNTTIDDDLIDWICVSPKDQLYPNSKIKQRIGDELKCVYVGQDLSMYDELKLGFSNLYLQPCYLESKSVEWNGKNFALTEAVVKDNPEWRLSLQTHKWMGVFDGKSRNGIIWWDGLYLFTP